MKPATCCAGRPGPSNGRPHIRRPPRQLPASGVPLPDDRSPPGRRAFLQPVAEDLPRILAALLDLRRPECHTRNTGRGAGISRIVEATTPLQPPSLPDSIIIGSRPLAHGGVGFD